MLCYAAGFNAVGISRSLYRAHFAMAASPQAAVPVGLWCAGESAPWDPCRPMPDAIRSQSARVTGALLGIRPCGTVSCPGQSLSFGHARKRDELRR